MLYSSITPPHIFLYVADYFSAYSKQNLPASPAEARGGKARREARNIGRVVGWCVSVTLACLTGTYSYYSMYDYDTMYAPMLLWLLSWEVVQLRLLVGARPGLSRTNG